MPPRDIPVKSCPDRNNHGEVHLESAPQNGLEDETPGRIVLQAPNQKSGNTHSEINISGTGTGPPVAVGPARPC